MQIKIPQYAKNRAQEAISEREKLPEYKKFGLTKEQADRLGIASGLERAKQIVRSKTISKADAKRIARFYSRFKNCKTEKCNGAIDLWGGRKWGNKLYNLLYDDE